MKLWIAFFFATLLFWNMPDKNYRDGLHFALQGQKPLFTFGIVADIQYCDYDPAGNRFYRESQKKLREAIDKFHEDSVSFIINLGDLIDRNYESFSPVLNIFNSSGLKVFHVTGNHDYSVDAGYKNQLPVNQSPEEGYYSFVYKNFRFIFLNGNEISTYMSSSESTIKRANDLIYSMKNSGEINAVEWNGGMGNNQLSWLANELNEASGKNEKVILICHFPVYPENAHNLLNYKEVLPILKNHGNIIAWLNGHNHAGNYSILNNIHFITFKGMVETKAENSFAVIEVYDNKLRIKGYGRENSLILEY